MKKFILIFLVFFTQTVLADEATLQESKYKYVEQSMGKGKPYFLELGAKGCKSCKIMGERLYKIKQKNPQYNIHFINVKKERKVARELKVMMIPTQIIYDKDGKEVYRNIGLISMEELNKLLEKNQF